ncbi:MAG TPA: C45 family autoproteolytic acyltransferase/hydrolase [Candidatus Hydrogenedens sp.]|nr:C45 family autoproteolytic acyltransferase/hydrolase [Candidatus Hydrogenedens sp.]
MKSVRIQRFFLWFLFILVSFLIMLPVIAQDTSTATDTEEAQWYHPEIIENPEVKLLAQEGAGKLYQVGDHLLCVLEGTHKEMGFQHGKLLADKVEHLIKVGYYVKALWNNNYTKEYAFEQAKRMAKHIPAEYLDEVQGIYEGVQAAGKKDIIYDEVLLGAAVAELLHFPPNQPPSIPKSCSNFACWGRWTPDGRLIHGRNLDWTIKADVQDDSVLIVWRPKGKKPYMMLSWAGGIGSVSGMSATQLTIGEMTLPSPNATYDGMPLFVTMRRVLEQNTLDEAVDILKKGPQTSGWNFIVGDGKIPAGRALEVDAKRVVVYTDNDPKESEETEHWSIPDAVRRTNHPINKDGLMDIAKYFGSEFNVKVDVQRWEQVKFILPILKHNDSFQRYDWLGKQITKAEKAVDIRSAIDFLANGPVFADNTLHSFVFDPKNQTAYISVAGNNPPVPATRRPFTKVDLKKWFE